jgi:alpha-ketoglutarate-dependent taurine dioxygenase
MIMNNENTVVKEFLPESTTLPLVLKPAKGDVNLVEWIRQNKSEFEAYLTEHGAVLLRGFGIKTAEDFNAFMKCFDTEPLPYMFRSSPREELNKSIKNIYLSTSYPNERSINMHNETSYSRVWGRKIVFCCLTPAEQGGETPIADSRKVLQDLPPGLIEKFKEKGVKYRRNLIANIGMPWQEVFQTTDKGAVESICKKNNITYEFLSDDDVIIEWIKPAVYKHPVSMREIWFNHVFFFNKFSRYEELGLQPTDFLPAEYLASETFFGDGSDISYQEYLDIKNAYNKNKVIFPYEKGDILFLDNMLTAHGRNPYKGDRTIATAIIEAAYDAPVNE